MKPDYPKGDVESVPLIEQVRETWTAEEIQKAEVDAVKLDKALGWTDEAFRENAKRESKLRCEIRVLQRRLKDSNRGAETTALMCYSLREKLSKAEKERDEIKEHVRGALDRLEWAISIFQANGDFEKLPWHSAQEWLVYAVPQLEQARKAIITKS